MGLSFKFKLKINGKGSSIGFYCSWLELQESLGAEGISLVTPDDITPDEHEYIRSYFENHLAAIISPFIIDREHPFPFVPSGGLCVVAEGRNRMGKKKHMLVPLPQSVSRFMLMPGTDQVRIIALEMIIIENIQSLFSDTQIHGCGTFQILRDNDLAIGDRFDDLRAVVETGIERRERADVIRLKFVDNMPEEARFFVARSLGVLDKRQIEIMKKRGYGIDRSGFIVIDSLLGLADAISLIQSALAPRFPHLMFEPYDPGVPARVKSEPDLFKVIKERDLALHYPYDDFQVLVDLLNQAASDPKVSAIKQTLYRTSRSSPIEDALVEAAEAGKSVMAVIELEARDDEKSNVQLAKRLEAAGAHVVYGIVDLKVHTKMTLIVRHEEDETVLYSHIGTGNYHPGNARMYTDLSLMSACPTLGADTNKVFNYLTSESVPACERIVVAPADLRDRIMDEIDIEIDNARNGLPAQVWAKVNSLTDPMLIEKLYEASKAGVQIDLVVRRHCRLRPGIPGLSDNIRVKSIVGRFLEHSRVYCFAHGRELPHDDAALYIASADWMERNFDDRVEIMVPVEDPEVRKQVIYDLLQRNLEDEAQSWHLQTDATYARPTNEGFSVQEWYMQEETRSGKVS